MLSTLVVAMLEMILVDCMLPVLFFSKLSATSLRYCEFKCLIFIIRFGFKRVFELDDRGLTKVFSNDSIEKNCLERIERISNVVKSLDGNRAGMNNRFKYVAFKGSQVALQITKLA